MIPLTIHAVASEYDVVAVNDWRYLTKLWLVCPSILNQIIVVLMMEELFN